MCTSFTYKNNDFYFGRNLDLDCGFGQQVVITPRNYAFSFHHVEDLKSHYALIGMATVMDGVPLYAEAVNEKGLAMAGLQFTGNAVYYPFQENKSNIAPYELIPWLLGQCDSIKEARKLLKEVSILDTPFKEGVPNSPLHWIIADKEETIVLESTKEGTQIYEDQVGVLTNNPPFSFHLYNLSQYLNVTKAYPNNRFSSTIELTPYAAGMGAIGLPGDASSPSRFIHTAFLKENLVSDGTEKDNVQQFFRVLNSVAMIKGSVLTEQNTLDYTIYSSCINCDQGIYYYTTYEDSSIRKVEMKAYDLDQKELISIS